MTRQEHLLTILAEECCELGKEACKALRFGMQGRGSTIDPTNQERIVEEFAHVLTLVAMLGLAEQASITGFGVEKKERVERNLEISRNRGTLQD